MNNAYAVETENTATGAQSYTIGLAEYKITKAPNKLVTLGLGSCIGLVLFDPVIKIAGMVHIMLPSASDAITVTNRFKFADTAVVDLIEQLKAAGAVVGRLKAKMAGGAHMFKTSSTLDVLNVGRRNAAMCSKVLKSLGITISGEDTGGSSGRSIEFCCQSMILSVRTVSPKGFLSI